MTDKQMLQELIEFAVSNNWGCFGFVNGEQEVDPDAFEKLYLEFDEDWDYWIIGLLEYPEEGVLRVSENNIIFQHEFAETIFGYELFCEDCRGSKALTSCRDYGCGGTQNWEYQLKELAVTPEKDRIKYAYENSLLVNKLLEK